MNLIAEQADANVIAALFLDGLDAGGLKAAAAAGPPDLSGKHLTVTAVAITPNTEADLGPIDGTGAAVNIIKTGTGTLVLDEMRWPLRILSSLGGVEGRSGIYAASVVVPEPGTVLMLVSSGVVALLLVWLRRKG